MQPGGGEMYLPDRGARTQRELLSYMGLRNGKASSRARAGLTGGATAQERFSKLGQTVTLRRDLA